MIKVNGIELELISDNDTYLFLEKEVRGGMSYIAKRYSKDNNKYMKLYNSNQIQISCIWMQITYMAVQ